MRLWAEELRLGTIELLLTMPVTPWQAILGKFLASWMFLCIALALTFPLVITVAYLGHPDFGRIACGYIGSFLLAGAFLSIASLTSALTRNQVVAFILAVVISLLLILCGSQPITDPLSAWTLLWLVEAFTSVGVMTLFNNIQRGMVNSCALFFFICAIIVTYYLTSVSQLAHCT